MVTAAPYGWMRRLWRRHSDVFSSNFPYYGRVVYVPTPRRRSACSPAIRQSSTPARRTRSPWATCSAITRSLDTRRGAAPEPAQAASPALPRRERASLHRGDGRGDGPGGRALTAPPRYPAAPAHASFLDGRSESYAWIPFGGGVRRCIGASFAQTEMKVVLREVLRRVKLRAASGRPERPRTQHVTVVPSRGARVIVEERLAAWAASSRRPCRTRSPSVDPQAIADRPARPIERFAVAREQESRVRAV